MKESTEKNILRTFKQEHETYELLDQIIGEKLNAMVKSHNFFVMEIAHRVKTPLSLSNKLEKKSGKYASIYDLTDLCGARIICYFSDTVDEIGNVIQEYFDLDEANSVDKRASLNPNQFGYLSLHYICSLKNDGSYDEKLTKIRFEIQIRTVLQHAWAEIEHDLGYKSEFAIPHPIRREFSRIAGLLEIADNQFVGLKHKTSEYESEIKQMIAADKADNLPLDQVTLREFTENSKSFLTYVESVTNELSVDYIPSPTDRYLPDLNWLGIETLGDLYRFFEANRVLTTRVLRFKLKEIDHDMLTTSMILRYTCRAELLRGEYSYDQILRFLAIGTPNPSTIEKTAQTIMEYKKWV